MKLDFKIWTIIGFAAVALVLMFILIFGPSKEPDDSQHKYESVMKSLQLSKDSIRLLKKTIIENGKRDSRRIARRDSLYRVEVSKLKRKIRLVDISKSTDKQLDSAIYFLYGDLTK